MASFLRYYAYEFDFKTKVVSLFPETIAKEQKAEHEGWRPVSPLLAVEDPFETFYDVAHVLKYGTFQKIRKEFVSAYSKICECCVERNTTRTGEEILEWICEDATTTTT